MRVLLHCCRLLENWASFPFDPSRFTRFCAKALCMVCSENLHSGSEGTRETGKKKRLLQKGFFRSSRRSQRPQVNWFRKLHERQLTQLNLWIFSYMHTNTFPRHKNNAGMSVQGERFQHTDLCLFGFFSFLCSVSFLEAPCSIYWTSCTAAAQKF